MKLYFSDQEDTCNTIHHYREYMKDNDLKEMVLYEAEIEYGTGYFWCSHFFEIGESKQGCGKSCEAYAPRNGKNGRCKYHKNLYKQTDKKITIKL